jgi:hypothetical protein
MGRKLLLGLASFALVPAVLAAYTVVLKDGRRIEAKERYTVQGDTVRFTGADGKPYQIPLAELDLAATEEANREPERPRRPRVWMNEDIENLARRQGGGISVVGTAAAPASSAAAEGEAEAEEREEGEPAPEPKAPKETDPEYWQQKLKPLREQLSQIEAQLSSLRSQQGQASSNALSVTGTNPGADVADTIRRLEAQRAQVQQQIEDLQAEAKRKGIPPGAVR